MDAKLKTARNRNGGKSVEEEEIVNDSLGTTTPADSTGVDEEKETGEAKDKNFPTKED